jgi:hypothetical protein
MSEQRIVISYDFGEFFYRLKGAIGRTFAKGLKINGF